MSYQYLLTAEREKSIFFALCFWVNSWLQFFSSKFYNLLCFRNRRFKIESNLSDLDAEFILKVDRIQRNEKVNEYSS